MVRPILMVYYIQSHPYELLLQSLPISAEALGSYPALQQQTAAAMVVAGYELEARLMGGTRMILPLLYSREPEQAACYLKENPDLGDIMCKGQQDVQLGEASAEGGGGPGQKAQSRSGHHPDLGRPLKGGPSCQESEASPSQASGTRGPYARSGIDNSLAIIMTT